MSSTSDIDIEQYLSWVTSLAQRILKRYQLDQDTLDDLISAGCLGLVEASGRFNEQEGIPFRQFARWRVVGAMIDSVRHTRELPALAYRHAKCLRAYCEVGAAENETVPIAQEHVLTRALQKVSLGAMLFRVAEMDPEGSSDSESSSPEELLLKKQERDRFLEFVESLPEDERCIVQGYYYGGLAFHEIAEQNGWSKSWVSKLHKRALQRVQRWYRQRDAA